MAQRYQRDGFIVRCVLTLLALSVQGCDGPALDSLFAPPADRAPLASERLFRTLGDGTRGVEGELLVRFRPSFSEEALPASFGMPRGLRLHTYSSLPGLQLIRLPPGADVERELSTYRRDPRVLYAEPNRVYSADSRNPPDDPRFAEQWGLDNTGQAGGTPGADIGALGAWNLTTGSAQTVLAIIDSGIDLNHPDLAANLWTNPGEIPGNGIDDDGNGYIDDVHGINAITGSGTPQDGALHGTHVAGILGAVGNNGTGITGVAWNASLLACKFLDSTGNGVESDAIKCLDYLLALKTRPDHPVNIIASNNSWSCGTRHCSSEALKEAIARHLNAGILFIASAGNASVNNDSGESWPAKYGLPNIIAVAATDRTEAKAGFSNYGPHTVHLAAPGVTILSTTPNNDYRSLSGTSMAAPHVTGVAGLLAAQNPSRDWRALRNLLLAGGHPVPGLANVTITGRRLSASGLGGEGALTCQNQHVFQRLEPSLDRLSAATGSAVPLAVLNIDCASPAGEVSVNTSGAEQGLLTLKDDGQGEDAAAGDGIYSGHFMPSVPGPYTLAFPNGTTLGIDAISGYAPAETPASVYEVLTDHKVRLDNAADETVSTVTSPFPIHFADSPEGITQLYVSSNGYITFSPVASASLNATLPSGFFSSAVIPLWMNLEIPSDPPSGLYYEVLGNVPNRRLVIEWRDVIVFNTSPSNTLKFQVVFFENSSNVEFNYANVLYGDPEFDRGISATVGVQVLPNGAQQYSYNTASLSNGLTLLFKTLSPQGTPKLAPVPAEARVNEGETYSLQLSAAEPGSHSLTFHLDKAPSGMTLNPTTGQLSWKPTELQCGQDPGTAYPVTVRVSDERGGSDAASFTVRAVNLPPAWVGAPWGEDKALDSVPYDRKLNVVNPGGPMTYRLLDGPEGMTVDAGGALHWTPGYAQCAKGAGLSYTVSVRATDAVGAFLEVSGSVTAQWRDTDHDGMSDVWEMAHGCMPTFNDALGDVDGDGVINLDAFNNDTGGPYTPGRTVLSSPADGAVLDSKEIHLVTEIGTDPDTPSAALGYLFEVYADERLTVREWTSEVISPGLGQRPSVTLLPSALGGTHIHQNAHWWRARATDGQHGGPWSQARKFVYGFGRLPPPTPQVLSPKDDAVLSSGSATLNVVNISHEADDSVAYDFELYAGADPSTPALETATGVVEQEGETTFFSLSHVKMTPGQTYAWRARAVSRLNGPGPWAPLATFQLSRACSCSAPGDSDLWSAWAWMLSAWGLRALRPTPRKGKPPAA